MNKASGLTQDRLCSRGKLAMSELISPAQLRAIIYWLQQRWWEARCRSSNLERKKRKEIIQTGEGKGVVSSLQSTEKCSSSVPKVTEFKAQEDSLA